MNTIKQPCRVFDPQQKITAVLSIWSERRTTAQLCQEMDIRAGSKIKIKDEEDV